MRGRSWFAQMREMATLNRDCLVYSDDLVFLLNAAEQPACDLAAALLSRDAVVKELHSAESIARRALVEGLAEIERLLAIKALRDEGVVTVGLRTVTRREVLEAADWCEAVADGRSGDVPPPARGGPAHMLAWDMMQPDMLPPRDAAASLRSGGLPNGWLLLADNESWCERCRFVYLTYSAHACGLTRGA